MPPHITEVLMVITKTNLFDKSLIYNFFSAVVVVFDMTNLLSLAHCHQWLDEAMTANCRGPKPLVFLVGTKKDLMVNKIFHSNVFFTFVALRVPLLRGWWRRRRCACLGSWAPSCGWCPRAPATTCLIFSSASPP